MFVSLFVFDYGGRALAQQTASLGSLASSFTCLLQLPFDAVCIVRQNSASAILRSSNATSSNVTYLKKQ